MLTDKEIDYLMNILEAATFIITQVRDYEGRYTSIDASFNYKLATKLDNMRSKNNET